MNSQATSLVSSSKDNRRLSKNDSMEDYNAPLTKKKIKLRPLKKHKSKKLSLPRKSEEMKNNYSSRINIISKKSKNIKEITEELSQNFNYMNKTRNKKLENTDNDSSMKIVDNHMNKTTKEFIHFSSLISKLIIYK